MNETLNKHIQRQWQEFRQERQLAFSPHFEELIRGSYSVKWAPSRTDLNCNIQTILAMYMYQRWGDDGEEWDAQREPEDRLQRFLVSCAVLGLYDRLAEFDPRLPKLVIGFFTTSPDVDPRRFGPLVSREETFILLGQALSFLWQNMLKQGQPLEDDPTMIFPLDKQEAFPLDELLAARFERRLWLRRDRRGSSHPGYSERMQSPVLYPESVDGYWAQEEIHRFPRWWQGETGKDRRQRLRIIKGGKKKDERR